MNLSKRAAFLIVPVLLASYVLVAVAVYYAERSSVERLEQARLSNKLTELRSTFSVYASFADSYLFALSESEALHQFLLEQDNSYRQQALGSKLEAALGNLTRQRSDYLSFTVFGPAAVPEFYFASTDNPFSEISNVELDQARQAWLSGGLSGVSLERTETGDSLLIHHKLIDRRTFAAPLATQRENSVLVQIAVELNAFDQQLAELVEAYDARVTWSEESGPRPRLLEHEVRLLPSLYLRVEPDERFVAKQLTTLAQGLTIGALVLSGLCALLLTSLMRRFITEPVAELEHQLNDVMHGQRNRIDIQSRDEIGRLAQRFQQLYGQLSDAYRRSRELAERDTLTELPNRNHFYEMAVRELKAASDHGYHVALLYIDLDHFKFVNDKYGHSVGDALLKSFSQRAGVLVKQETERSPRAGQAILARLAGDEFAVLLYRYQDENHCERVAQALLGLVEGGYRFEMGSYPVTCSVGIARYPQDGHTITQLISNADTAMYQAKNGGKNQVAFYSQELARQARWSLEIEHQLKAIDFDEEFFLTYMPILDGRGRIAGCEALLRWYSPVLGAVRPDQFIPIAERTGLYSKLDRWVIAQALSDFAALSNMIGRQVQLSINLSSAELTGGDVDRYIGEQIQLLSVPADMIEVEMTETVGVDASRQRDQLLHRLRDLGLQIAIDDFGTGYTSMMQMLEYPVDKIKLDRSFVERLMLPGNFALLEPIISLCHARGLKVTAEGVETEAQAQALIDSGCDLLQGFLYGQPMRLAEFELWLQKHQRDTQS
ncbi:putative bifunctional diguanylate cyclase/phosphodiesterase [Marinobacterium litorale]|uniref:putative bifunctional diguanylate cyclase/phosphodiesterase n=1 Tax=Marinobacterium litorale TaxID=404770 RepID=UPI000427E161|nr:EAL domain-containing protein [Marinobacterium litorale]